MRTTLNIDDDILQVAKERASKEHRSTGEVISELARKGFRTTPHPKNADTRNGVVMLPPRDEVTTLDHVEKLLDKEGI